MKFLVFPFRNSMMYRAATLTTARYRLRASSCPNIYRNSMTTLAKEDNEVCWCSFSFQVFFKSENCFQKWYSVILELCETIFDFSFFTEFHFLCLSIGVVLLFTFFIVPYFYLPDLMSNNGYTMEDGSRILGNIGVINGIGMVSQFFSFFLFLGVLIIIFFL